MLNSKIPAGPLEDKWTDYKGHCKLVNPANKRKLEVIVVGTGLAGASAAAALGELGYRVKAFLFPGFTAQSALHRSTGRHKRRKELSK